MVQLLSVTHLKRFLQF